MNKKSKIFTYTGIFLLAAAVFLAFCNFLNDMNAKIASKQAFDELGQINPLLLSSAEAPKPEYIPNFVLDPEMDMPVCTVESQEYIGILSIPSLKLELPIISQWSYPKLKISPCLYTGSAYLNNMVIAGHNYSSHFGKLGDLTQGDTVTFTDVDGNLFAYKVSDLEILSADQVTEMVTGDWDLTLFTCTTDGKARITIRCDICKDTLS